MSSKRLLFVMNDSTYFISHRLPVAVAAKAKGFEVHVATPPGKSTREIQNAGLILHEIPLSRSGKNPVKELKSLLSIYRLMRTLQADVIHLVAIKPVIYGGLMARLVKVSSVVAAISGLGTVFIARNFHARFVRAGVNHLYRLALKHANLKVIFQNPEDRKFLVQIGACSPSQTALIRGSGVDLLAYKSLPETNDNVVVVMISRLLKDKGVLEFVAAAKILKSAGIKAQFLLIGEPDPGNPTFINESLLELWRNEGHVQILGFRENIAQLMAQANIVVLPSYREGLPKVLVEAAACGRAVITTDTPGCRDAIENMKTGLLVPVRDANALALAMQQLIENPDLRQQFGKAGRELAEREFAIEKIVADHLKIYNELEASRVSLPIG